MSEAVYESVAWDWMDEGSCANLRPLFFPERDTDTSLRRTRTVCYGCGSFEACTGYALENPEKLEEGTFAGLTAKQRREIAKGERGWVDWREDWNPIDGCLHHRGAELVLRKGKLCCRMCDFSRPKLIK